MNKADKCMICFIVLFSLVSNIPFLIQMTKTRHLKKEVVVEYQNEEVLRKDLSENATYTLNATLGDVIIEVKDNAVRVEKETSPYHLCSIQGWVNNVNQPIICLPNEMIIQIEANDETNEVDTIIQ